MISHIFHPINHIHDLPCEPAQCGGNPAISAIGELVLHVVVPAPCIEPLVEYFECVKRLEHIPELPDDECSS